MKAIVQDRYGSSETLRLDDIERPSIRDDEVLVRVHAASVHADVWHAMRGLPYVLRVLGSGLRRPKNRVPGTDLAGSVESVGRKVKRFVPFHFDPAHDDDMLDAFFDGVAAPGGAFTIEPAREGMTFEVG